MRFSLRINNDLSVKSNVELARLAEDAGFDQMWVSNDLFLRSAPVLLAAVAQATQRMGLGTGILNPYTVHPAEIAMIAATLDELSGGRFHLGLAAGAGDFLGWVGIEQRAPLAATREAVAAVRGWLAGERAAAAGEVVAFSEDAYLRFQPLRSVPIYVGAMGPRMLELAGEIGDGALPLLLPPEHYHEVRPLVERGLGRRPSPPADFDLAACIWVSVDADRDRALKALAIKVAYYGHALSPSILKRLDLTREDFAPIEQALHHDRDLVRAVAMVDERMLRIGVAGSTREVITQLEPLVEAGVEHLSFGPPLGPDPPAAVRLLGERVLPYFGAGSAEG